MTSDACLGKLFSNIIAFFSSKLGKTTTKAMFKYQRCRKSNTKKECLWNDIGGHLHIAQSIFLAEIMMHTLEYLNVNCNSLHL